MAVSTVVFAFQILLDFLEKPGREYKVIQILISALIYCLVITFPIAMATIYKHYILSDPEMPYS